MLLDLLGLLQPAALTAEEPPPRAPRPRSFAEDALPFATLIVAGVTGLAWADEPVRSPQLHRPAIEETTLSSLKKSFQDEELLRAPPAHRARAEDALPLGARATPFLWQETPLSLAFRRVASADDAPPFDPLQVALKSFQDGDPAQHAPRTRATAEDTLPLSTRIAFLWQETPQGQPRRARAQIDDAPPFDPLQVSLRAFLDVDSILQGKNAPQKLTEESFVPLRVLAPTLNDDPARPRALLRARAEDIQPWNRVLLSFLNEDLPARKVARPQRTEDVGPLTPLEESDLASFLEGEHLTPIKKPPQSGGDSYLPLRVLASFLDLEPPPLGKRHRSRVEEAFIPLRVLAPFLDEALSRSQKRTTRPEEPDALALLDQNDVAAYIDDERPLPPPRRYARANDTFPEEPILRPFLDENVIRSRVTRGRAEEHDVLTPLDQNDVVSFLDDERASVSPRHRSQTTDAFPETRVLFPVFHEERISKSVWRSTASDAFPEKPLLKPFLDENAIRVRVNRAHSEETDALPPFDQNDVVSFLDDERLRTPDRRPSRATDTFPEKPILAPFLDESGRIQGRLRHSTLEETDLPPLDQNEVASFLGDEALRHPTRSAFGATDALPFTRLLGAFLDTETPVARALSPRRAEESFSLLPILKPFLDESLRSRVATTQSPPFETDLSPLDQNDVAAFLDEEIPPRSHVLHAQQSQEAWPEKPVLAPFFLTDEIALPKRLPIILIDSSIPEILPEPFRLSFLNQDVPRPSAFVRPRTAETTFQDAPLRPKPPPPTPPKPKPALAQRSGGGGGGGGGDSSGYRLRQHKLFDPLDPPKVYLDLEEQPVEPEVDYALINVVEDAVVRALAAGRVTHFRDARGRQALKLEADDGTNYYYANLSRYVGVNDRRVESGETIARSARESTPEIKRALPSATGGTLSLKPQQPRTITPVLVEPRIEPLLESVPSSQTLTPQRVLMRLIPIEPSNEWGTVTPPSATRVHPIVGAALFVGTLAAFFFVFSPTSDPPERKRKRKRRRKPRRG